MASNVLYKTKKSETSESNGVEETAAPLGRRSNRNAVADGPKLDDEGQFAAEFQQQNHHFRWGKGDADSFVLLKTNVVRSMKYVCASCSFHLEHVPKSQLHKGKI